MSVAENPPASLESHTSGQVAHAIGKTGVQHALGAQEIEYGHSWFVDPVAKLTVVLLTNTALEGMMAQLTFDLRNAVYESLRS